MSFSAVATHLCEFLSAFPDAFPHFGSDEYWETETRDLEEQLDRIERGEVAPGGSLEFDAENEDGEPAEGELTNKDFFWDLD